MESGFGLSFLLSPHTHQNNPLMRTESLIPYITFYYCAASPAGALARAATIIAALVLLVALFRALGAVAEDHFAPAMERAAAAARLPPRLAGATLLALGNGAPDIASAFAAARTGRRGAIDLAFGALLGAGLFVGCVVGGLVVRTQADGVPARGALVRDVLAYGLAAAASAAALASGSMTAAKAGGLLGLYALYVATVAGADAVAARQRAQQAAGAVGDALLGDDRLSAAAAATPPLADLPWYTAGDGGDDLELSTSDLRAAVEVEEAGSGRVHPPAPPSSSYAPPVGPLPAPANGPLGAFIDRLIYAAGAAGGLVSLAAAAARWVEQPLALARSATIPVVVDGDGVRDGASPAATPPADPWLPVALFAGPVVGLAYLGAPWPATAAVGVVGGAAAAGAAAATPSASTLPPCLARLAPPPALARAALTLTSATCAILWVDATAAALVGALQLLTTISRTSPALAGGTLLAWGNSAGDAASNVAIARRGLPNMALTACFAGPATNLLLGLGSGLLAGVRGRAAAGKGAIIQTRLGPGGRAATAFVWAMVGVVLGSAVACKWRLPRRAAGVLGGVYAVYMVVGVSIAATASRKG